MQLTELSISELGPMADGICLQGRGRVFVERALPGDRVRGLVQRDDKGISRAEIVDMVETSPYRQVPPCVHYDHCGNCTIQHLQPKHYREWKMATVGDALRRQNLHPRTWIAPVFVGPGGRRRATFSVKLERGVPVMGYFRRRSQDISDIDACLIADPRLLKLREVILPYLPKILGKKPADIFLQLMGDAIDMVITGPVGRGGEPDDFVQAALENLLAESSLTRISWRSHEKEPSISLFSKAPVTAYFGKLKVSLPPAAFLQPTAAGEKALVAAVMAALPVSGHFADLFSGCGTFSGPMLERAPVDAYESVATSVKALGKAGAGSPKPLKVMRRDLFTNPLRRDELNRYNAIVFDPPRAGAPEQVTLMATAKTRTIIGVSCNPATFARDARILCDGGYRLQSVQLIDQFHWSHHVEVVGVFSKR